MASEAAGGRRRRSSAVRIGRVVVIGCAPFLLAAEDAWETHFRQGEVLERQANYSGALAEFSAALREAELQGSQDWKLPLTLHNLGQVNRELGLYFQAERFYLGAIAMWERDHPARTLELAMSLANLGALYLVENRPSRAAPLCQRAYELRLRSLPAGDPVIGASLHGLAQVKNALHQYPAADDLYRRSAGILEQALGGASQNVADVWHNWAVLCRDLHRTTESRRLLERAIAVYDQGPPDHPRLAIVLRNLAELEAAEGHVARADALFTRSAHICEASLPPGHPQTGIILQAYAKFLKQMKRGKEAKVVAERARAILSHADTIHTVDVSAFARR